MREPEVEASNTWSNPGQATTTLDRHPSIHRQNYEGKLHLEPEGVAQLAMDRILNPSGSVKDRFPRT